MNVFILKVSGILCAHILILVLESSLVCVPVLISQVSHLVKCSGNITVFLFNKSQIIKTNSRNKVTACIVFYPLF